MLSIHAINKECFQWLGSSLKFGTNLAIFLQKIRHQNKSSQCSKQFFYEEPQQVLTVE